MHVLRIETSLHLGDGQSTRLARAFCAALERARKDVTVTVRDLAGAPLPHLDAATFAGFAQAEADRTPEVRARVAQADALIAELHAADLIVLGLPMYNFGVPSTLKAWIDHVMRAGVTFRYTSAGVEGQIKGKRVVIVGARGGSYVGTPLDQQLPYVKQVLAFMGMTDVDVLLAEGLAQSAKRVASLEAAEVRISELAARYA